MNWVAPIKDDTTLEKFKQKLREVDDKYYILFEIGVGTGLQLQEILKFRNKDIRDKDSIEASIGTKNIKRTFQIPQELKDAQFELAALALTANLFNENSSETSSTTKEMKKVGPIEKETTFTSAGSSSSKNYPEIDAILDNILVRVGIVTAIRI